MKLIEPILQFHNELQQIRRTIHAHPELSFEEVKTSDLVAKKLTECRRD
jgi:hippurate hydrolase